MNTRILYFGNFDPEYARNRVIIRGLRENGAEVLICRTAKKGILGGLELLRLHNKIRNKYDVMIIGYSDSRFIVPLAKLISKKEIVWDAFYSLYDSWVFDRKLAAQRSFKAAYYRFMDWLNCKLANKILLDTNEHIKYFNETFNANKHKLIKVLVGTDDSSFNPKGMVQKNDKFIIHFHGKFIPLQGTEYIIEAANILKGRGIAFQIIGNGQEYDKVKSRANELKLSDITWIDAAPYEELAGFMSRADVCLGIFGHTEKTARVIPNKVYEAIAMAKPVMTADTPSIRELFIDRENILLCRRADSQDLADKILELKNDSQLRRRISANGYKVFKEHATPFVIGKNLIEALKSISRC